MSIGQGSISYTNPSAGAGGGNLPGVTDPFVDFTIGDGQAGTPANGATFLRVATLQGQSLFNKRLLVLREAIPLNYNTAVDNNGEMARYNSGGLGGFTLQLGLFFSTGDRWQIYIIGIDNTIET